MALDPMAKYDKLERFLEPDYSKRQFYEELQRRASFAEQQLTQARAECKLKDKQLMAQQIDQWRTAIEELGKMEVMLTEQIGREKGLIGTEGMGWPGRLDQLVGELTRYREALMRRIADKALERLAPALEVKQYENKQAAAIMPPFGVLC